MRIVEATEEHVWDWMDLIKAFYAEGVDKYGMGIDEKDAVDTYMIWIRDHISIFLETDDGKKVGCFAAQYIGYPLNYKHVYCQEMVWFVLPGYRGYGLMLYREALRQAKAYNCRQIVCGFSYSVMPRYFIKMYNRLGFKKLETHYIKDLRHGPNEN